MATCIHHPLERMILEGLSLFSYLSVDDVARLVCHAPLATTRRVVRRMVDAGLIEEIPFGGSTLRVFVLTGTGVIALATLIEQQPEYVWRDRDLDRRHLLASLAAREALIGAHRFLFALNKCLWLHKSEPFPWVAGGLIRWETPVDCEPASLTLLGQTVIPVGPRNLQAGLLWWDQGDEPERLLAERVARVRYFQERVREQLPPMLLVVNHAYQFLDHLPPGVLWARGDDVSAGVAAMDVLPVRWSDHAGRRAPLLDLLADQPRATTNPTLSYIKPSNEPFRPSARLTAYPESRRAWRSLR